MPVVTYASRLTIQMKNSKIKKMVNILYFKENKAEFAHCAISYGRMEVKMEGSNLLTGGVDELNEIKEYLLELRGNQANSKSRLEEEERLERSINALEKAIAEEIQATAKKRRDEIEEAFDRQLDKTWAKVKKIKEKRNRKKSSKVSERIAAETASLRAENNRLKLEAGSIIGQRRMPSFCNTKLYYALYAPSCFTDLLIIAAVLAITLLAIPCGIYFLVLSEERILYMVIIYVVTVLFFGSLYLAVGNRTKGKYSAELLEIKDIRSSIRANRKKIGVIKRNIKKDRDESLYGLQSYDNKLAELDREAADITNRKKEALETFENSTKQIIASEIQEANKEKLSGLRTEYDRACEESKKAEDMIKALTIKLAGEYEPFIGKDLMTLDRLESLTNIILAGNAANISEAVAFYRQNMNKAPQD